jgi:NAD(P)-dependent dehydrogenase (short-subunit alcohol dehydrogenase family)
MSAALGAIPCEHPGMRSFGFESTTDEVLEGIDLTGRRVLVTGASAGLGVETTRSLAAHGASVTMAVRDLTKGAAAMDQVLEQVPEADLDLRQLDLADLSSVRTFAHGFLEDHPVLHVLIGNAGIMACPEGRTVDGFELQFGTNHLGHFLLVDLLTPALVAAGGARVVLLSSAGHRFGDVDLDDPGFERQPYDAWVAYGRAKTANVLCAVGIDQRLKDQGVRAFAVHPGGIQTELGRHLTDETLGQLIDRAKAGNSPISWKTVEQGAATTVWAATAPELDGEGARYLEDCGIADVVDDPNVSGGVRAYAIDPERADALWELSRRLCRGASA